MANPVNEDLHSWQNDHLTADTNLPAAGSAAGIGDAQDLSGNLRMLKSVIRGVASHLSWERWLGMKSLVGGQITFAYNTPNIFAVTDNFTATGRGVAVVGRRVRGLHSTGTVAWGTISGAVYAAPTTTVTVSLDAGSALAPSLYEVQFGLEPAALALAQPQLMINRTGYTIGPGWVVSPSNSNDNSVTLPLATQSPHAVFVAASSAPNNGTAQFFTAGLCPAILVVGGCVLGRFLVTTGAGDASAKDSGALSGGTTPPFGAFAIALSGAPGPGGTTIPCMLLGHTVNNPPIYSYGFNAYGLRIISSSAADTNQMGIGDIWYQY